MGGRSMGTVPMTLSLVASFMSAITLLGTPAEMYVSGTQYCSLLISYPLVMASTAYMYLPVYTKLKVGSWELILKPDSFNSFNPSSFVWVFMFCFFSWRQVTSISSCGSTSLSDSSALPVSPSRWSSTWPLWSTPRHWLSHRSVTHHLLLLLLVLTKIYWFW